MNENPYLDAMTFLRTLLESQPGLLIPCEANTENGTKTADFMVAFVLRYSEHLVEMKTGKLKNDRRTEPRQTSSSAGGRNL